MTSPGAHKADTNVRRLHCEPNNYPWGKKGSSGLAARLATKAAPDFKIDENETYAELWMGTHPKQGAKLWAKDETLAQCVSEQPQLLGDVADAAKFPPPFPDEPVGSKHVPFLFKILSCKQALPLQIHPNKELAEKLHKKNPEQFPDTNHKPEIAVCLSERFLGFAGFRPYETIRSFLLSTPEVALLPAQAKEAVKAFVGQAADAPDVGQLRETWQCFLELEGDNVAKAVDQFCARVAKEGSDAFSPLGPELDTKERLALVDAVAILREYNKGEAAIFTSVFFMNLMELKKGDGMYVGADGPHAWLSGDIVELMAISDNVLNVGFTPEKDSTRLVAQTVTGQFQPKDSLLLHARTYPKGKLGKTTVYSTPAEEFSILRVSAPEALAPLSGPGIAICTEGNMTLWDRNDRQAQLSDGAGTVYFVSAGTELGITGEGEVWMAFYDADRDALGYVGATK
ncbi:Mannose-6-phosphate isomerase [Cryptotrichosporon argae]